MITFLRAIDLGKINKLRSKMGPWLHFCLIVQRLFFCAALSGIPGGVSAQLALQPVSSTQPKTNSESLSTVASGFIVAPRTVLTAHHAVAGKNKIMVGRGRNEPFRMATLLAFNEKLDLALIRVNMNGQATPIADWSMVPVGIEVYAIGFPRTGASSGHRRITAGLINGEQTFNGQSYWFQFSAEVHRGNSGGPVIAADGSVIGIVTHKVNSLRVAEELKELPQNVNFGLKSSKILEFLNANGIEAKRQALNHQMVVRPHDIFRIFDDSVVMIFASN
jgi:S1-C subfamily serine protease